MADMLSVDPWYVGCHTCHAQGCEPCRWAPGPEGYHPFRVSLARRVPDIFRTEIDHALAHGVSCVAENYGDVPICTVCGRKIAALRPRP